MDLPGNNHDQPQSRGTRHASPERSPLTDDSDFRAGWFLLAITAILTWLLTSEAPYVLRILLFIGMVVGPALKLRWFASFGVTILLFMWLVQRNPDTGFVGPESLWYVLLIMGYLSASMRLSDEDLNIDLKFGDDRAGQTKNRADALDTRTTLRGLKPLTAGWLWIPASMVGGMLMLQVLRIDEFSVEKYRITREGWRCICLLWFMVTVWLIATTFLNFLSLRQSDPLAAGVFARSVTNRQLGRELMSVEKRLARRKRQQRTQEKTNQTDRQFP